MRNRKTIFMLPCIISPACTHIEREWKRVVNRQDVVFLFFSYASHTYFAGSLCLHHVCSVFFSVFFFLSFFLFSDFFYYFSFVVDGLFSFATSYSSLFTYYIYIFLLFLRVYAILCDVLCYHWSGRAHVFIMLRELVSFYCLFCVVFVAAVIAIPHTHILTILFFSDFSDLCLWTNQHILCLCHVPLTKYISSSTFHLTTYNSEQTKQVEIVSHYQVSHHIMSNGLRVAVFFIFV